MERSFPKHNLRTWHLRYKLEIWFWVYPILEKSFSLLSCSLLIHHPSNARGVIYIYIYIHHPCSSRCHTHMYIYMHAGYKSISPAALVSMTTLINRGARWLAKAVHVMSLLAVSWYREMQAGGWKRMRRCLLRRLPWWDSMSAGGGMGRWEERVMGWVRGGWGGV